MQTPQAFTEPERDAVYRAIRERRDVRRGFLPTPIPEPVMRRLLEAAHSAPSVGLMQPWRFLVIREPSIRQAVHDLFLEANNEAHQAYQGTRQDQYANLKLEGLLEAPQHLCIVCDADSPQGHGLGRRTMPETALYSTVCAIQNLWLAARAEGIGTGWVSILDPRSLRDVLRIPENLTIVAYLCLGYVDTFATEPDLERYGWEQRTPLDACLHFDRYGSNIE